ncbi:PP2C family protein-serine/threonine phosphatase [Streptomyces xinghaiensis]|uniref:PP2C family protein-serine/threonine phosphatase n=1 Tax=Streptomyces xinghaiensis TaxID=1038928 RepID=UPI002E1144F2|nr:serine/threonine-protein phosphatase [Streptomyces xinghaiensis]
MVQRGQLCSRGDGGTRFRGAPFPCWIPGVLIVGGLAFGLLAPPELTGSPFFAAAPMVAAALYTGPATILTAVVSSLAMLGIALLHGTVGQYQSLLDTATVVTVAGLAVFINRVVRHGHRALASVRNVAEAAQRAVLPAPAGRIGGLRVAARYEAAQADAGIGGDLYAVQSTPHGVRLIVGDVRGKGIEAVGAVAIVLGAFREAAEEEPELTGIAERLEVALVREAKRREGLERAEGFTTAVLAEIPHEGSLGAGPGGSGAPGGSASGLSARRLRLLNRGHPAPLMLTGDGAVCAVEPEVPAVPLGLAWLRTEPDRVEEIVFPRGCTLLLFTDGVTEARNRAGEFYDPQLSLAGRSFSDPEELLDTLVGDVALHTGGRAHDDMALLAVTDVPERRS